MIPKIKSLFIYKFGLCAITINGTRRPAVRKTVLSSYQGTNQNINPTHSITNIQINNKIGLVGYGERKNAESIQLYNQSIQISRLLNLFFEKQL